MNIYNNKEERYANAMRDAIAWLDEIGISYRHLPPYQIKIGALNFWPGKGTITIDGDDQRRPENGLAGLKKILVDAGLIGGAIRSHERKMRLNQSSTANFNQASRLEEEGHLSPL